MRLEGKKDPSENVSPSTQALELVDHDGPAGNPHGDTSRCKSFQSLAHTALLPITFHLFICSQKVNLFPFGFLIKLT
jgi:hypothetical protein